MKNQILKNKFLKLIRDFIKQIKSYIIFKLVKTVLKNLIWIKIQNLHKHKEIEIIIKFHSILRNNKLIRKFNLVRKKYLMRIENFI